ncbi:MAG: SUMF1/EgtB/PvdO family nonheme iron enzyme [Magnetococcus sp. YQC-9]
MNHFPRVSPRSLIVLLVLLASFVWSQPLAADTRETIRALAASAEKDLRGHRFTQPNGMNALEKYQKILAIEPDNPLGREGLKKIVSSFQELSKEAEAEGNPNLARQRTQKAKRVQSLIDTLAAADKTRTNKVDTAPKSPPAKPMKPKTDADKRADSDRQGDGREESAKSEKMAKSSSSPEAEKRAAPPPPPPPARLQPEPAAEPSPVTETPKADMPQIAEPRQPVDTSGGQPAQSDTRSAEPAASESVKKPVVAQAESSTSEPDKPEPAKPEPAKSATIEPERKPAPPLPEPMPPEAAPKAAKKGEKNGQLHIRAEPVTGLEFVEIPGGCFKMGSEEHDPDEKPVHELCVKSFWMSRTEVTNGQFHRFDAKHNSGEYDGHALNGDLQPVVNVTWEQARQFAGWMSGRGGVNFRLPTEAEWEYAARAGSTTAFPWGDNPGEGCRHANVGDAIAKKAWPKWNVFPCADGYAETAPVGMFLPNGFGLFDMIGNVWEWVADWYSPSYYASSPKDDPKGPQQGFFRTARGGSWAVWPDYARTANRTGIDPSHPDVHVGFRLVMMP